MMSNIYKIVRVFVGSPGGLQDERRLVSRVAEEINDTNSEHWECRIEIVGWEDTLPGMARPQELINRDLDSCDYFIGIMWDHWGSTPDGAKYTSGFEEEFERAKARVASGSMKDIFLYFKEVDPARLKDPGPSLLKVLEFRTKCIHERGQLFKDYREVEEFERHVRKALTKIGWREVYPPNEVRESQAPRLSAPPTESLSLPITSPKLLDNSCIEFLKLIIEKPSDWDQTTAIEVARFRLISQGVERTGNDAQRIGNHDANLLYRHASEYVYSSLEKRTLLNSAIAQFNTSSVPLWHWLFDKDPDVDGLRNLEIAALFGGIGTRQNAIEILCMLGMPTPKIGSKLNEENVIKFWMETAYKQSADAVFKTAMGFLAENGSESDLKTIELFIPKLPDDRKVDAINAIVSIALRQSVTAAIQKILNYAPESVDEQLVKTLFGVEERISTKSLLECLNARAGNVRKAAIELLERRGSLDKELALKFISDPEIGIRFVVLSRLRELGEPLSDDVIASSLTKYGPPRRGGLMSLLGSPRDASLYLKYKQAQIGNLPFAELKAKALGGEAIDDIALQELFARHYKKLRKELRRHLKDGFSEFTHKVGETVEVSLDDGAIDPKLASRRKAWIRSAAEGVAHDSKRSDLNLLRVVVDRYKIGFSAPIVDYFEKYGEFVDVRRVLSLREDVDFYATMLPASRRDEVAKITAALVKLGRAQIIDVFELITDNSVRTEIFRQLSRTSFRRLEIGFLARELNRENTQHRTVISLRSCDVLPKASLKRLLEAYWSEPSYYYDVIHWIDAGLSMPRAMVQRLVKRQLRKLENA